MTARPALPPAAPPGAPEPPWRLRAWAPVTSDVGRDDGALWRRWWGAICAADAAGSSLAEVAATLGVQLRRLHAARSWLRAHAPGHYATLRPREHISTVRRREKAAKGVRP